MTTTTTRIIVLVRRDPLILGDRRGYRIYLPGTGKVIGRIEPVGGQKWRAAASEFAFIGDSPDDGAAHPGDWAPRRLYMPLLAAEGHYYLPGEYPSDRDAEAALLHYLDKEHAPAMGHPAHPDVQHRKA